MSRYTKRDYQHLTRAAKCDLCGENFKRDDERELAAFANHPHGMRHVAAHPDCIAGESRKRDDQIRKARELLLRGAELIEEQRQRNASAQRLREMGLII